MERGLSPLGLLAAALLSSCAGSGTDGGAPGSGDGNDTFASSQAVAIGTPVTGTISSATDDDWYVFTTTGAGQITVALSGLSADADLALYDAAQHFLTGSTNTGTVADTVTHAAGGAATFHVRVIPAAVGASYTLTVGYTPGGGGDGNDTFGTAQVVTVGSPTAGVITSLADPDWYKFTVAGAGSITVSLGALTADANLALYDATQTLKASSANAGTATDTVAHAAVAAGTFYVQVVPQSAGASYQLTVAFIPAAVVDANDTFATAQPITVGTSISGEITSATDPDWYQVATPGPGTITATLSGLTADADLELYGSMESLKVAFSYNAGTAVDTLTYTANVAFNYRLLVVPQGAATPYVLTTAFTPAP